MVDTGRSSAVSMRKAQVAATAQASYDPDRIPEEVPSMREQRRLAAIVAADVVGYSRLMGRDESGTLARLREHRKQLLEPALARHGGRLVKLTGDGALMEFGSAVEALSAAIEFQQAMTDGEVERPEAERLIFRVGVHLGDVIVDGDDLYGDGINIAARLEAEASAAGIVVSGAVHEATAGRLKATFEDLGRLALKNIERPVQAFAVRWLSNDWLLALTVSSPPATAVSAPSDTPLPLPDKPSIAVLPFQNMSGDPEQEYFVDGLVEDIITALSRYKSLFVIARNSSFTYKGRAVNIKLVGRELGVRYVLEGSVRKAGNRVRITGQLVDAVSGAHVWANRFDRDLTDIFALQDEATQSVVAAVEPNLRFAEIARKTHVPTQHLNAYDLYLRALADFDNFTENGLTAAEGLLRRAVEIDPSYSDAWTLLAQALFHQLIGGWRVGTAAIEEANQAASIATKVGPENGLAHAVAGTYPMLFGGSIDDAVELTLGAIALHPNSEMVRQCAGWTFLYSGEFDTALGHLETGLRIAPVGRGLGVLLHGIALTCFFQRRFNEAIDQASRALAKMPQNPHVWRVKAAALAHAGRIDEARDALGQLLTLAPESSIATTRAYFRHQWMRDLYRDGLRKAGLPE